MPFWKLVTPAVTGQERELETVERRRHVLENQLETADEARVAAIKAELEMLRMRRSALRHGNGFLFRVAGALKGNDPRATEYLEELLPGGESLEAFRSKHGESYVIGTETPLATPIVKAPSEIAGPFALDASILETIEGLDPALVEEAWEDHDPHAMLAYRTRLLAGMEAVADAETISEAEMQELGVVVAVANWLVFWAENEVGFEVIQSTQPSHGSQ